jgi:hypothetical protein
MSSTSLVLAARLMLSVSRWRIIMFVFRLQKNQVAMAPTSNPMSDKSISMVRNYKKIMERLWILIFIL